MASDIRLWASREGDAPAAGIDAALSVFSEVEAACTRFDRRSPLMKANAEPHRWHEVPKTLYRALQEAYQAYDGTRGLFDPRVFGDLVSMGYDRTLPFDTGDVVTPENATARRPLRVWRPQFRDGPPWMVHLGGDPVDLGGIGKGLAARWAAERLNRLLDAYLLDAGGDCICRGDGPDGNGWRVGVEDPCGNTDPLAVLELRDVACATSSIRLRRWRSGARGVHHLIDPRTGEPGGSGLLAVTVVAQDPADAEVLTKALFLSGRAAIGSFHPLASGGCALGGHERSDGGSRQAGAARHLAKAMTVHADPSAEASGTDNREPWERTEIGVRSPRRAAPGRRDAEESDGTPARSIAWASSTLLVVGCVLGVSLVAGNAVAAWTAPLVHNRMLPWILGRSLGVASYLALTALVVIGTWLRHPWRRYVQFLRPETLLRTHVALAAGMVTLVMGHLTAIALDHYAGVGWVGAFAPWHAQYRPTAVTLGTLSLYGMVLVIITAALAGSIARHVWFPIHGASSLIFCLSLAHGVFAGSDSHTLRWMYVATGGAVAATQVSRWIVHQPPEVGKWSWHDRSLRARRARQRLFGRRAHRRRRRSWNLVVGRTRPKRHR